MNAIIEHVWTPDELAHQGSHGTDNVTAEEQLRGTIALEGHRGTTVTITFPL
jgi:hypothetical protein